ncbi:glycine zipper 2TM domain-containing protein [Ramlibacter pallidus]|uniref:Glycine zipper 2TM domain-containing protein n=1 Tax=Ramlibacter pallidus TaxID=2780087 RepID=A0ABR9S5G8_9BURK|nr:glycine zipper 2TM domain-containing protein [Ramlibacter pallidus]MBE7368756.1 glycine zipper 2TM domain-containing protein [Ramlibacter pallidus]
MRNLTRLTKVVAAGAAAAMLAACASTPYGPTYPTSSYPTTTYPVSSAPVAGVEYGRILNIEYMPVGTAAPQSQGILGAVVGGVAGALLGSTIGGGSGRTAATVLGGVAGAAVGNSIARNQAGVTTAPGYRITMQSDSGIVRTYEVPATGDLRVGDRVRVDGGVIYRG